ncbi:hypothetical protein RSOL_113350 [Rhizoctonia solani AG-3 Rhs1AP]|uniref:Uncharacterized protein n=1 Tax=Rhizoctonia solani AG-3 Rhs1AP TaxID=1086054 RepID=X8J1M3_9AGAM|nr:hypothetical protein RSOL_113350 [Rhizoctonia solani AG-3 Rhs1AP]
MRISLQGSMRGKLFRRASGQDSESVHEAFGRCQVSQEPGFIPSITDCNFGCSRNLSRRPSSTTDTPMGRFGM